MKHRLRALIVDDEPPARRRLQRLLAARDDFTILGTCRNGHEAVDAIRAHRPELLFLDVQMPGLDGVGVIEAVGLEAVGAIVFTTAYDRYALRAFDFHAVDYLLKPFSEARFHQALDRARDRIGRMAAGVFRDAILSAVDDYRQAQLSKDRASAPAPAASDHGRFRRPARLAVRSFGRTRFIEVERIDWLEAAGSYVRIHTGDRSCLIRRSLRDLAAALPTPPFLRIHRRTVVNVSRVVEVRNEDHRELTLVLEDGTKVKVSRSYRDAVGPWLGLR